MFTVLLSSFTSSSRRSVLVHAAAPLPQTGITIDTQTGTEEEGGKEKEKRAPGSSKSEHRDKASSSKKLSSEEEEIRQANELRAKLGMKPLR